MIKTYINVQENFVQAAHWFVCLFIYCFVLIKGKIFIDKDKRNINLHEDYDFMEKSRLSTPVHSVIN